MIAYLLTTCLTDLYLITSLPILLVTISIKSHPINLNLILILILIPPYHSLHYSKSYPYRIPSPLTCLQRYTVYLPFLKIPPVQHPHPSQALSLKGCQGGRSQQGSRTKTPRHRGRRQMCCFQ